MNDSFNQRFKSWLPSLSIGLALAFLVYFHGLFLPFLLAWAAALWIGPSIRKLESRLPNWNLSVLLFLSGIVLSLLLFLSLSTGLILRDIQRFNQGFEMLWDSNQAELDKGATQVKEWLNGIYDTEKLEAEINTKIESLQVDADSSGAAAIDWDAIGESLSKLKSLFVPEDTIKEKSFQLPQFSFWYQFGSFLLYFVLILFYFEYFERVSRKLIHPNLAGKAALFWQDFQLSFVRYFQLRTRIILWQMPLFILSFVLLDLPGTFLYLGLIFFLLYIPYLHYILLLPMSLSALVLSTELSWAYWIILAIIVGTFLINSLLEELLLIPRIMERNIGLNPVLMILGLSFWTYTFGNWGILFGIPLTSLSIIYLKRYILPLWFPEPKNE